MTWADLTKTEQKEVSYFEKRYGAMMKDPDAWLEKQAEKEAKQEERQTWVETNKLACFKCGATSGDWAAGGIGDYGPWVLCVPCVRKPR